MVSHHPVSINKYNERKTLPEKKSDKFVIGKLWHNRKETPCDTCLSGVITVEAAWVLPLCVCFFVCILFLFRVMQVQLLMQRAVSTAGAELAVAMAGEDCRPQTQAWILLKKELARQGNIVDYIDNGISGIRLSDSKWDGDNVSLVADYQMTCPISVFGKLSISLSSKAVCHKWIGWTGGKEGEADSIWVYVTETGNVYHRSETCSYLNLSIKAVSKQMVNEIRNDNGGKYYPCRLCTPKKDSGEETIFITNQGSVYHHKLKCSGLKRTIYRIRLSAVGDRRACSRCG